MLGSGDVLETVCEYMYYNLKHKESKDVQDMKLPTELLLQLVVAANYLDGVIELGKNNAHTNELTRPHSMTDKTGLPSYDEGQAMIPMK